MTYLQDRPQTLIHYDRRRFDFRAWAHRALGCPAMGCSDLGLLHRHLSPSQREDLGATRKALLARLDDAFGEVADLYRRFVAEVVAPRFGKLVSYQDPPIFRVQLDGFGTISPFHCDRFFNDDPESPVLRRSRNVWVPLTPVAGNNSLWIESAPGAGDHRPVAADFGQALIFDAMSLEHGSRANDTGVTRVSFELRSLPSKVQSVDHWAGPYLPTVRRLADGSLVRGPSFELRGDGTLRFDGHLARGVEYREAGSRLTWTSADGGTRGDVEFHDLDGDGVSAPRCNFTGTLDLGGEAPTFFSGALALPSAVGALS
ncbi:MAG: hypothetical protein AAGN66_10635 [Acidobacteriota bacterium]